jgi:V/A-type H+-transporting ATPase subunit E
MDRIFTEIRDSVAKEAEQLLSRARRVAEREKEHAQREAESIITEYREKARREAHAREERIHAHRVIETRKRELAQRQAFVEAVFSRVLEELRVRPRDDDYRAWLKQMIGNGLTQFRQEKPVLYCNKQDRELVDSLAGEYGVACADTTVAIAGGIIMKSIDNRMTVDCSAEAELHRLKEEVRDAVLERLQIISGNIRIEE